MAARSASDSSETSTDTATETPAATDASGTVKYTGFAGVREITKRDWTAAKVTDQDGVVWDADNAYTLPKSAFSSAALEVLKRDKNIKISS